MQYHVAFGIGTTCSRGSQHGRLLELQCFRLPDVVTTAQARLCTATAHHKAISVEHSLLTSSHKNEYLKRRDRRPWQREQS